MERRLPENTRSPLRIVDRGHLTEAALEVYSLGRMTAEEDLAELEEHLLVCALCQQRLEKFDTFHHAVKEGAKFSADNSTNRKPNFYVPIVIAAGLAGILLMPVVSDRLSPPLAIDIQAFRNETSNSLPAGRKLAIRPDLTGLQVSGIFCQLVSEEGKILAEEKFSSGQTMLTTPPLSPGQHWIRLKSVNASGELLREFSLLVR